jgi:4-hydroxy-3-methylbut-2-enyl diphosphate reductase IspH
MGVTRSTEIVDDLSESGFQVIVYGREDDPEVRNLVGHSKTIALQDPEKDLMFRTRKVALLRQRTEQRDSFADFVSRFVAHNITHIYELRVINTLPQEALEDGRRRRRNGG